MNRFISLLCFCLITQFSLANEFVQQISKELKGSVLYYPNHGGVIGMLKEYYPYEYKPISERKEGEPGFIVRVEKFECTLSRDVNCTKTINACGEWEEECDTEFYTAICVDFHIDRLTSNGQEQFFQEGDSKHSFHKLMKALYYLEVEIKSNDIKIGTNAIAELEISTVDLEYEKVLSSKVSMVVGFGYGRGRSMSYFTNYTELQAGIRYYINIGMNKPNGILLGTGLQGMNGMHTAEFHQFDPPFEGKLNMKALGYYLEIGGRINLGKRFVISSTIGYSKLFSNQFQSISLPRFDGPSLSAFNTNMSLGFRF